MMYLTEGGLTTDGGRFPERGLLFLELLRELLRDRPRDGGLGASGGAFVSKVKADVSATL